MSGRLHVVLRVRELQERAAERALAEAERDLQVAVTARTVRAASLDRHRATIGIDATGPRGLQGTRLALLASHDAVQAADADVAAGAVARDGRRTDRVAAAVARRSVERLVERRAAVAAAEAARAEQATLDEVGGLGHLRRQP